MKKKILIVGATGFLGFNFAKKCLKNNFKVTSLSRKKPTKQRYLKNVKYIFANISKKKELYFKLNKNFDYVINFAGDVDHHGSNTYASHFNGCKNLADIFKKKKISRFIQIGSSVEYGNQKSPHIEGKSKVVRGKVQKKFHRGKKSGSSTPGGFFNICPNLSLSGSNGDISTFHMILLTKALRSLPFVQDQKRGPKNPKFLPKTGLLTRWIYFCSSLS